MADPSGYEDKGEIPDDELLYRGVHHKHVVPDGIGGKRVSSASFKSKTNPHPSVDRSSLCTAEETLNRLPTNRAVGQLIAETPRQLTVGVVWDPIDGNQAHAVIIRDLDLSDHEWGIVAKKLALACTWAIPPPS